MGKKAAGKDANAKASAKGANAKGGSGKKQSAQVENQGSTTPRGAKNQGNTSPRGKNNREVDEIEALRAALSAARKNISLKKTPTKALELALRWIISWVVSFVGGVLKSPITWFLILPLTGAWIAAKQMAPDLFLPPDCGITPAGVLWNVELAGKEVGWWLILGILSSVGFGTGLHSGLMFLFPHVMQVVTAAEACHTTTGLVGWYQHPCKLDCHTTSGPKDDSTVTFYNLWCLVTIPCMIWGVGTAFGELPPYLVSKAARMAGGQDEEFASELEEARTKTDLFSRMKMWTVNLIEKHGFIGVLLLASWPNAAFDMCGMCCGYLLMPFWTFFLGCAIGKGMVKTNGQAVFFVNLFGTEAFKVLLSGVEALNGFLRTVTGKDLELAAMMRNAREMLVQKFEFQSRFNPQKLLTEGNTLDLGKLKVLYAKQSDGDSIAERVLHELDKNKDGAISFAELNDARSSTDGKISLSALDPGKGTSILKMCWELFIVALVLFFVFSCVEQLARMKQAELDEAEIEKRTKRGKKKD